MAGLRFADQLIPALPTACHWWLSMIIEDTVKTVRDDRKPLGPFDGNRFRVIKKLR